MSIERILMPTDFSPCAEAALDRALALAKQHEAELHVLHVIELHAMELAGVGEAFPDLEDVHARLEALARSEFGERLGPRREGGVLVIQEAVRRGIAPAAAVADYSREEGIDLVVIGTHGRRGLRRLLLGSVTEEVVRTAPCPVLTIPGAKPSPRQTPSPFDHVVVPYDFSPHSARALDAARDWVRGEGQIDVVHVIPPPLTPNMYAPLAGLSQTLDVGELRGEVERRLIDRIARYTDPKLTLEPHVLDGQAASAVTEFATRVGADLIIVGSHGLTGFERALLGSTSAGVIRTADLPVLVLRDFDAESAS